MAAYASILSLINLIHHIQTHPNPPITLHKHHAQSLSNNAAFVQQFLEVYSHQVTPSLKIRIADAAYAAQDVIDSHVVDRIQGGSNKADVFHEGIERVVKDLDFVTREVMEVKDKLGNQDPHLVFHGSKRSISVGMKNEMVMVGLDDALNEVMDKLTGDQSGRQVISLVGMGGIGKTTLATNAYENRLLVHHFDIRSWITVSQNYSIHEILLKALDKDESRNELIEMNEQELGEKLYKSLFGRRYLVVLDDIWSVDVWNEINRFFPDNNNRSRILITTRLSSVASEFSNDKIEMNLLDDEKSWNLFCKTVFEEGACPVELEESGKQIMKNCNGLPLSITIIGRLLAKFNRAESIWASFAKKLNLDLNLEYENHCLQIIRASYDHLPIHLKPCFLYMGVFPEDSEISASYLIRLWVVEGFVKPICDRTLESVAEEYLMDLMDRNLILFKRLGPTGRIKCHVHDLTRDLCIMEAEKEKFFCIVRDLGNQCVKNDQRQRRIAIDQNARSEELCQVLDTSQSSSHGHSLFCDVEVLSPYILPQTLRVLRVTNHLGPMRAKRYSSQDILQLVNLRFVHLKSIDILHPSIISLWNLQVLILPRVCKIPLQIWKMFHLRHVKVRTLCLADPSPTSVDYEFVLQNLQTLSVVECFTCDEEVIKRIPNIRKLGINYPYSCRDFSQYRLNNLSRLQKLESLFCSFSGAAKPSRTDFLLNITFPNSLLKLQLMETNLHWEDITMVIGSLPNLQVLKLVYCVEGPEWNLVEGKFQRLKYLQVSEVDLKYWRAESSHFPCLEHLYLGTLFSLEEIPLDVGDAPALQSIKLYDCSKSALDSAQRIVDEQAEFGNFGLRVEVHDNLYYDGKYVELRPNV